MTIWFIILCILFFLVGACAFAAMIHWLFFTGCTCNMNCFFVHPSQHYHYCKVYQDFMKEHQQSITLTPGSERQNRMEVNKIR